MSLQSASQVPNHFWRSLDDIESGRLRDGLEHWNGLRGERRWPTRADLKLRNIKTLLPYIALVQVIDDGADFEHRIVGDALVQAFAVPVQNRRFSDIAWDAPEFMAAAFDIFRHTLVAGEPLTWLVETRAGATNPAFFRVEFLLMPLGDTEDRIDHLLVFGVREARLAT